MAGGTVPPATLGRNGVILDTYTQDELPNYEGLCLVCAGGLMYVMSTYFVAGARVWDIINEGPWVL